jgi:hypothetical protein
VRTARCETPVAAAVEREVAGELAVAAAAAAAVLNVTAIIVAAVALAAVVVVSVAAVSEQLWHGPQRWKYWCRLSYCCYC